MRNKIPGLCRSISSFGSSVLSCTPLGLAAYAYSGDQLIAINYGLSGLFGFSAGALAHPIAEYYTKKRRYNYEQSIRTVIKGQVLAYTLVTGLNIASGAISFEDNGHDYYDLCNSIFDTCIAYE